MGCSSEKVSHVLLDAGFFCALGTSEYLATSDGLVSEGNHVGKGAPLTWDRNNGVTVVCDEDGRPWISVNRELWLLALHLAGLKQGAHVPHSNDCGFFVSQVLPKLISK